MRGVIDNIVKGSYGKVPDLIYTSIGGYNAYMDLLISENQPTQVIPDTSGFAGGATFQYGSKKLPVIASPKAAAETMFFLSRPTLFKYFGKMGWADRDGLLQRVSGYLSYEAVYRMWVQFGTNWPEANGRLNDITET